MATQTINKYSLVDVQKRTGADGRMLQITDVIAQENAIIDDFQWEEGTDKNTHIVARQATHPTIYTSQAGQGFKRAKGDVLNVDEFACQIGADAEVDVRIAKKAANPMEFRKDIERELIAGMGETFVSQIFTGDRAASPLNLLGLRNRDAYLSTSKPNVTNAAGSGSSVLYEAWIIEHGQGGLKAWFPRGSQAGLVAEDKGEQRVYDANNDPFYAYVSHFQWDFGLSIYDDRAVQRVVNLKPTDSTQAMEEYLVKAINKLKKRGTKNTCIYLPRPLFDLIDIRAMNKSNAAYGVADIFGRQVTTFRGIPVRMVEALNTPFASAVS